jgi:hypothetical protein
MGRHLEGRHGSRQTRRWDAADTLETKQDIAAYLEDGDPNLHETEGYTSR